MKDQKRNNGPFKVSIDLGKSDLPQSAKDILQKLKETEKIVFTGGVASFLLLEYLREKQGKIIDQRFFRHNRKTREIGITIGHYGSLPLSESLVVSTGEKIEQSVKDLLSSNNIHYLNFSFAKVKTVEDIITKQSINALLSEMDLTVHEVLLVYERNKWRLYYTPRCWRDSLNGIGRLTHKKETTTRRGGIIIPNGRGLCALLEEYAMGRVREIVVPEYVLNLYKGMNLDLQKRCRIAKGACFGRSALELKELGTNEPAQKRLMQAISRFGFTKQLEKYDQWIAGQKAIDLLKYREEYKSKRYLPVKEKARKEIERRRNKGKREGENAEKRDNCEHRFKEIVCGLCLQRCRINICRCKKYNVAYPDQKETPCSFAFINGHILPGMKTVTVMAYPANENGNHKRVFSGKKLMQRRPLMVPPVRQRAGRGWPVKHI